MFLKPRFVSRIALLAAITLLIGGCTDEGWRWHYSRRADRFYRAGELEKAKQEYLNLLRVNRGDKEAIARLGLIWAMEGAPLQAYGYLKKTAENNPEIREVHAPYGRILLTFGDVDSARREAETLLENSPLDDEAILLLA